MTQIAPSASVDPTAELGDGVILMPGSVIGARVRIGDDCEIKSNAVICEGVQMGSGNRVFANCVLGEEPQMLAREQGRTELVIGNDNVFREGVTVHRGTTIGGGKTSIGNNCYFMAASHLGHDCIVEDHVVVSNATLISGHVRVEERAWLGAINGVHQFATIGRFAYTAGMSTVHRDIPPFVRAGGAYPCTVRGLNVVGMQRAGVSEESLVALKDAYRALYGRRTNGAIEQRLAELLAQPLEDDYVRYFLESVQKSFQHRFGRYLELHRS